MHEPAGLDGKWFCESEIAGGKPLSPPYLFGDRADEIVARYRPGEGLAWHLADRLGTVRDIVNAAGAVINHIEYDSFGNVILETNPAAGDRFKFTGREFDTETGLYYFRARYYDPQLGRFVSQDPLGLVADVNLYRYVGNSPLNFTDPSGLLSVASSAAIIERDIRIANTINGFTIGYCCGFLDAHYRGSPNPTVDALAEAAWAPRSATPCRSCRSSISCSARSRWESPASSTPSSRTTSPWR